MKGNNGSELHRLTELKPYDEDLFNRLYKTCKLEDLILPQI